MQKFSIDFKETGLLNNLITDYVNQSETAKPFYQYEPSLNTFEEVIAQRRKFPFHRATLVNSLHHQYEEVATVLQTVKDNINSLLDENTFTVTTGHQLCIFSGPLYMLYKIISTINLAKALKEKYPSNNFVPIYWMASEDHDFAEINHIHLFNKKLEWKADAKGAAGELSTENFAEVLKSLKEIIGESENANKLLHLFEQSYLFNANLSDAMRAFINELFGKYGIVIVDANNHDLKKLFIPIMEEELLKHSSFAMVNDTSAELERLKYKPQVNPRNINLFFLEEGVRERIVQNPDGNFEVVNSDLSFNKDFMINLLHTQPERFSPNVVLRPVYQEVVLPNLAYVGGPGELSYWMQYKSLFEHHQVHYPLLKLRSMVLILDANSYKKMHGFGLIFSDLFKSYDDLVKKFIAQNIETKTDFLKELEDLKNVFDSIEQKVTIIDQTLASSIKAEQQKALNSIDTIDKKVSAAIKRKHETALSQIKSITEKVFPDKVFQERYQNFIPYYLKYGDGFIDELIMQLQSYDQSITLFVE